MLDVPGESTAPPRALLVYFSYSGQARAVVRAAGAALRERGWLVREAEIRLTDERYAATFARFPLRRVWPDMLSVLPAQASRSVADIAFPEVVFGGPYDLVCIGSPTWWGTASLPVRSFLSSAAAARVLDGRPFAVLAVCRDSWRGNVDEVRDLAQRRGGRFAGEMHLTYPGGPVGSVLALTAYLGSGRQRDRYLGVPVPPTNVSAAQLDDVRAFAGRLADRLGAAATAGPQAPAEALERLDMPLREAMTTQRAIRRVLPDPVDDDVVRACIELAQRAPTGQNGQQWEFVVVRDRAVKAALGARYRRVWDLYHRTVYRRQADRDEAKARMARAVQWQVDHFPEIPVLVVACLRLGVREGRLPVIRMPHIAESGYYGSIYPGVQNLLLAARAMGLGASLITMPLWNVRAVRRLLGLPRDVTPICVVPLGWPRGRYGPSARRPVGEVVHLDRFGTRPWRGD